MALALRSPACLYWCVAPVHPRAAWSRLSLAARFALASAIILLAGAAILGTVVTLIVETSVIRRVAADSALYVEALIGPEIQTIEEGGFGDRQRDELIRVLEGAAFRGRVVSVKVWSKDGSIVYATDPHLVGRRPSSRGFAEALAGSVISHRSDLSEEEHAYERALATSLIETYVPLRRASTDRVIAVAEFYQSPDELEAELGDARLRTWGVIAAATIAMYGLLAGMVRAGSDTIGAQRRQLEAAVTELAAAARRLREVSAARAETDEAVLRRVAHEIHDGLAQDLATALLALERGQEGSRAALARVAIESALVEVRGLAYGLALPDLGELTLREVIEQACVSHERKSGRAVPRVIEDIPDTVSTQVKIAAYRVIQEALANALRHAPNAGVRLRAGRRDGALELECEDEGPGLPADLVLGLGIRSMRERVELLGGGLEIRERQGGGTLLRASIPMSA